ncbi:MAG: hypothetical protein GY861_26145 [bacterium]|nr:hypothetical protein [bacterium]
MSIKGYSIPVIADKLVPSEVKRVKILTGKYKGMIKDFCHFTGDKVVVKIGAGHRLVYNKTSVEFVESEWVLTQEVLQ